MGKGHRSSVPVLPGRVGESGERQGGTVPPHIVPGSWRLVNNREAIPGHPIRASDTWHFEWRGRGRPKQLTHGLAMRRDEPGRVIPGLAAPANRHLTGWPRRGVMGWDR